MAGWRTRPERIKTGVKPKWLSSRHRGRKVIDERRPSLGSPLWEASARYPAWRKEKKIAGRTCLALFVRDWNRGLPLPSPSPHPPPQPPSPAARPPARPRAHRKESSDNCRPQSSSDTRGAAIVKTILRNRTSPRGSREVEGNSRLRIHRESSARSRALSRIQVDNAARRMIARSRDTRQLESGLYVQLFDMARGPHSGHSTRRKAAGMVTRGDKGELFSPWVTFSSRGKCRGPARADNRATRMHTAPARSLARSLVREHR